MLFFHHLCVCAIYDCMRMSVRCMSNCVLNLCLACICLFVSVCICAMLYVCLRVCVCVCVRVSVCVCEYMCLGGKSIYYAVSKLKPH